MKIEDIKIGEMYNLRVRVVKNNYGDTCEIATVTIDENGKEIDGEIAYYTYADAASFSPITPEKGKKNTEASPKHDPCRELRIGDKVRVRKIHGKLPQCRYNGVAHVKEGDCCTIFEDAYRNCYWVTMAPNVHWCFDAAYLELVTPMEEMERFYIENDTTGFAIVDRQNVGYVAHFKAVQHPHAKEAAEAECKRLNEEYRKEQK